MLISRWDVAGKGPDRRKYTLTRAGKGCLVRLMQTLDTQMTLIGTFLDHAWAIMPDAAETAGSPQDPRRTETEPVAQNRARQDARH